MDMVEILTVLVALAVGVLIGSDIGRRHAKKELKHTVMGRLRIDHSEPDEPTRMFVELKGVTPDMIAEHEFVTFEVINKSYLSLD